MPVLPTDSFSFAARRFCNSCLQLDAKVTFFVVVIRTLVWDSLYCFFNCVIGSSQCERFGKGCLV